jgi:hypothetical protein
MTKLKAAYTSSLRPKTLVAEGLMHTQAGKKRPHDETSGFFSWFDRDNEDEVRLDPMCVMR